MLTTVLSFTVMEVLELFALVCFVHTEQQTGLAKMGEFNANAIYCDCDRDCFYSGECCSDYSMIQNCYGLLLYISLY